MCISTGNFLIQYFSRSYALFDLRNLNNTTETVCQCNSSEATQQNFMKLCSYEGHNILMCISTGNFDSFLTKMKNTTETVCQCNSTETAQQNFLKLCSYEGHNV